MARRLRWMLYLELNRSAEMFNTAPDCSNIDGYLGSKRGMVALPSPSFLQASAILATD